MKKTTVLVLLAGLFVSFSPPFTPRELLSKVLNSMDNIKTMSYRMKKYERLINGKIVNTEVSFKIQTSPFKVYVKSIKPNPGAEAIYLEGQNGGEVLINPNGFPFFNISLNPHSSLIRDDQHHTILHAGFSYISSIIKSNIAKYADSLGSFLSYDGEITWNGTACYQLSLENKAHGFEKYTVKKGETVTSIANRLYINDYMLLALNKKIKNYTDVKPGQVIIIPNSYARKITLYVDKNTFIPVCQIILDDNGLYEKFEFSEFVLNPDFKPEEFTAEYKEYGF